MTMAEIREKARALGIGSGRKKKLELVREIQTREGNFPCFGTATDYCDQLDCCFREDCLRKTKSG